MDIEYRRHGRKWIAEVWDKPVYKLSGIYDTVPLTEKIYEEINDWSIDSLGYHARTANHIFEFKKEKDLTLFLLRWVS